MEKRNFLISVYNSTDLRFRAFCKGIIIINIWSLIIPSIYVNKLLPSEYYDKKMNETTKSDPIISQSAAYFEVSKMG